MTTMNFPKKSDDEYHVRRVGRFDYSDPSALEAVSVHEIYDEKLCFPKLYTDKGELLVLKTAAYGAGWSTYCREHNAHLLMDARIVWFFYNTYIAPLFGKGRDCWCRGIVCTCDVDTEPMSTFLESIGLVDIWLDGLKHLEITLVSPIRFQVTEYDGCESIKYFREEDWFQP